MKVLFLIGLGLLSFTQAAHAALPKRLVLAVDGVSYRRMQSLQKGTLTVDENGKAHFVRAFTSFHPVSPMISVFPSESDVSWADILQLVPPRGYQRCYYSYAKNGVQGDSALSDLSGAADYEKSMHWHLEGFIEHLTGFLFPNYAFEEELKEIEASFFKAQNTRNFYAYVISTDDIQHMAGDVIGLLLQLDQLVKNIEQRYTQITGEKLEVVLLSDHGHNEAYPGKRVDVSELLERLHYRLGNSLEGARDVVIPTSGIMNAFKIYNRPELTVQLAHDLLAMEGVDLITYQRGEVRDEVVVINPSGESALIRKKGELFSYTPLKGDPLSYNPLLEQLRAEGKVDSDNFAAKEVWFERTVNHYYPVALERIIRGHQETVMNPAPILVSLKNGYEHVDPLTKNASQIVTTGGTHGGLDTLSSTGILMSNFRPTVPTTTDRLAQQFEGLSDLHAYRLEEGGADVVNANMLLRSSRSEFLQLDQFKKTFAQRGEAFIHLWHPELSGEKTALMIEINNERGPIFRKRFSLSDRILTVGHTGFEIYFPVEKILAPKLKKGMNFYFNATIEKDGQSWPLPELMLEINQHKKVVVY